jgi:hypothetical protein
MADMQRPDIPAREVSVNVRFRDDRRRGPAEIGLKRLRDEARWAPLVVAE